MAEYKFYIQQEVTVEAENFEDACAKFGNGEYTITDEEISDIVLPD